MKIKEIYIDGFGHFHNYTLRDISPRLTIIRGPNEAGKSTLLAFIRRILFGKPPGRSFNPYDPLNGGEHGGRLTVETDTGTRYDIARTGRLDACTIRDSNGSRLNKPVESVIGSADKYFYDNVFAFGLEELYKFETLSDESVQNHVTGAGVGLKTCSIPVLQKTIKEETNSLFKSGARSKPLIMKTLKEIDETEKKIRSLSKTQQEYDACQKDKRAGMEELSRLKILKTDIQKQKEYWKRIADIWDDWAAYQEISLHLAKLPAIVTFPENGIHELERIRDRIQEREDGKAEKERERENLHIDLSDVTLNTAVLEHEHEIHRLERGLEKYLAEVSSRSVLSEEISQAEDNYQRNLSAINPHWDDSALLSFDFSPEAQSLVAGFRQNFARYEGDLQILSKEAEQIKRECDTVTPQLRFIQETLRKSEGLPSEETVQRKKKAIDELYTEIPALDRMKSELEGIEKEEAAASERWKEKNALITGKMPLWPAGLIIAAGILSLGMGVLTDSLAIGGGLFILFFIVAGVYWSTVKNHESRQSGVSESDTVRNTEKSVLEWSDIRRKKQDAVQNFGFRLAGLAEDGGFSAVPSIAALNSRRNELERLSKAIAERENQETEKNRLEEEINAKKLFLDENTRETARIEGEISGLKSEWRMWLREATLPDGMLPDIVLGVFPKIEHLAAEYHALRKNTEHLQELTVSVEAYESQVDFLCKRCQFPSCGSVEGDLESAVSSLNQNAANQREIQSMELSCRKLESEITSLTGEIEALEAERTALLQKGSSGDEEQFREFGRVWNEGRELNTALLSHRNSIGRAAGKNATFEEFIEHLEMLDYSEVSGTITELEEKLAETEGEIEGITTRLGQISETLAQLETEDESMHLESKRLLLCEDLRDNSREWAKRVIAGHILGKAVERYEKERQPAVIREATDIFSEISDGRYQRIIKPLESDGVLVEEGTGGRKRVDQLSRGTAEQLYLALRFGYITEFGKHDVALPVVFDDILVNFDPVRKENSCRAIAQLAEKNQILYFTCHPDTVELLKKSCSDAVVIDLEKGCLP